MLGKYFHILNKGFARSVSSLSLESVKIDQRKKELKSHNVKKTDICNHVPGYRLKFAGKILDLFCNCCPGFTGFFNR